MAIPPGCLRKEVDIAFSGDTVKIGYALWETTLPAEWVCSRSSVQRLLERTSTWAEALADPHATSLIQLLHAQGCFVAAPKDTYTLREVRDLFEPLKSSWYAAYYAHPLWERLRSGEATYNELVAWLIHNYHVSRAAGVVAARMASLGTSGRWREFFEQDALEEYWHCDAFYLIDPSFLRATRENIKAYVPLPSSTAFEQHTLRTAERDALGHVLTAYFQEASIVFEKDSDEFYGKVESAYAIPSFFQRWKDHIRIDVAQGHASGLRELLDSDITVTAEELRYALSNAWLSFYFLRSSLDDISDQRHRGNEVLLRLPIEDCNLSAKRTAILPLGFVEPPSERLVFSQLQSLYDWYLNASGLRERPEMYHPANDDLPCLLSGLAQTSYRALGFARSHDDVVSCGRAARFLTSIAIEDGGAPRNPWALAVLNYVWEATTAPIAWLLCVSLALDRLDLRRIPESRRSDSQRELSTSVDFLVSRTLTSKEADSHLTSLLQLDELINLYQTSCEPVPADLLAD